jgi:hypothetical protein
MKGRDSLPQRDSTQRSAPAGPTAAPKLPALALLQRQLGNSAVARLLADGEPIGKQGGVATPALSAAIAGRRGRGRPLATPLRARMEQQFATSFDDVSLHHDAEADRLAHAVSARAFTTGSDIFLSRRATPADQALIAHELTHVVQQRSMSGSGPLRVTAQHDQTEREAEQNARD